MNYETIKGLYTGVKNGDIDESKLEIILDNDDTGFYVQSDGEEWDDAILHGNGYSDIGELYELLFPKAIVGWCDAIWNVYSTA